MRITVLGTGYLGAVHAAGMAELGHDVLGVDVDAEKIAALAAGRAPFFEPGLPELLRSHVDSGNLRFTTSLEDAAEFGDVHFICVGTPQTPGAHAADMRHVRAVVEGLAPHLRRACLIVGKSTVPVLTAAWIAGLVAELAPVGAGAEIAWNPEFLREGLAVQDTLAPDRLVFGVQSDHAESVLREVYSPVITAHATPVVITDLATAELVKVSANAFLATKISFINAMSEMCEAAGGDVLTLADAIGHDQRIGRRFLSAGLGFGGGCLPKDIRAFRARAGELGVESTLTFLQHVDEINTGRRTSAVELSTQMLGGSVLGRRIGILGAAFKPDSDDVRDSPALNVAAALELKGAQVRVHDPEAVDNARRVFPTLGYTTDLDKVFEGAELVVHATEWSAYRDLDPARVTELATTPQLLDTRCALDVDRWRNAGWSVRVMGRPTR